MAKTIDQAKLDKVVKIQNNLKKNGYATKYSDVYVDDVLCTAKVDVYCIYQKEVKQMFAKKGFDLIDGTNSRGFGKYDIIVDVSKQGKSIEDCFDV